MPEVADGLSYVDLQFLGQPGLVATGVLRGRDGVALVDPGPTTTLPSLLGGLKDLGVAPGDVQTVILTHIHLDHAGATGTLLEACPNARVWVHERGAAHLVDPSKLLASASRLYGDEMERLWGDVRPVPADRLDVLSTGGEGQPDAVRLRAAGHDVEIRWTPGHASHQVGIFLPAARVAFVGDTAGLRRSAGTTVVPATPPPDVDLEAWRRSTDLILAWEPEYLFLTHFGPHADPAAHFGEFWRRTDAWLAHAQAILAGPGTTEDQAQEFMRLTADDLTNALGADETAAYINAGRFDFSFLGLRRYLNRA
jgi:glyoxylase-like metal-dependent hydrolase (beta-lactamase superfamily II)